MRLTWSLVVALSLAGPLQASAQQSAPPTVPQTAGERYRSARVLREMPATDMIPTMAFIANSLGVTCAHCHVDDWASDEKPAKERAREMIRMTRTLNDTRFGGTRAVTCQTCHNGRVAPSTVPLVENAGWNKTVPLPTATDPLPAIADVLATYDRAVGRPALDRLASQLMTGTVTRNSGRTAPVGDTFELYQARPRTLKLSTNLSHPPDADADLPVAFLEPSLLTSVYPDLRVTGRDTIAGRPVIVVAGTTAGGKVHALFFDAEGGLLVRRADEIETVLGRVPERYDFGDYRRIDGVMVPHVIDWSRADYHVTFRAADVTHNVPPPKQ